jgi:hypothetical protein
VTTRRRRSDRSGRGALRSPGRPPVARREDRRRFWAAIAAGRASEDAAADAGVSPAVGARWFRQAGGMPPSLSLPRPRGHPVKVHHAAPAICSWAWAGVKKPRPECRRRRL